MSECALPATEAENIVSDCARLAHQAGRCEHQELLHLIGQEGQQTDDTESPIVFGLSSVGLDQMHHRGMIRRNSKQQAHATDILAVFHNATLKGTPTKAPLSEHLKGADLVSEADHREHERLQECIADGGAQEGVHQGLQQAAHD